MIQDIFDVLGFKQEEAKTYLALVESGPRTATELSKLVGAPRPTIYGYLERLLAAGTGFRKCHARDEGFHGGSTDAHPHAVPEQDS
jgi:predicted transcriptional regulator